MSEQVNSIRVDGLIWDALDRAAKSNGKTIEEVAAEAITAFLNGQSWRDLVAFGQQNGRESGKRAEDIPEIVDEWRREQVKTSR